MGYGKSTVQRVMRLLKRIYSRCTEYTSIKLLPKDVPIKATIPGTFTGFIQWNKLIEFSGATSKETCRGGLGHISLQFKLIHDGMSTEL